MQHWPRIHQPRGPVEIRYIVYMPFILEVSVTMVDAARVRLFAPNGNRANLPNRADTLRGTPIHDVMFTICRMEQSCLASKLAAVSTRTNQLKGAMKKINNWPKAGNRAWPIVTTSFLFQQTMDKC